jgi:hypothetical protein
LRIWQNQYVRDLAWAVASPCIIDDSAALNATPPANFFANEFERFLPALIELEKNPRELVEFLDKSKRKALGNYFEDLLEFWMIRRTDTKICTKILARNLQIIDGKTTLGECDFIAEIDGKVTHIEVAIKYYLAVKNRAEQKFWVGRGLTDRLDIKCKKLFEQQLQLSDGKAELNHVVAKMAIMKGYFFKHYFTENHVLPQFAPKDIEESFWCRISEIDKLPEQYSKWQILTKPHWLTYSDEWFDRSELRAKILHYFANIKETPVLCNCISNSNKSSKLTKFFIVGDYWSS